ncbi:MAG: Tn3 family transposase [Terriglobia bacterium]
MPALLPPETAPGCTWMMCRWSQGRDCGAGGEFTSNRREDQEVLMLCLHLPVSLVYVNTLIIQQVLAETGWQGSVTTADLRPCRR